MGASSERAGIAKVIRQTRSKTQKIKLLYLAIGQMEHERMKLKRKAQEISARKNWCVQEIRELTEPRLIEVGK